MPEKQTLQHLNVHGKTILLRVDYNVPFVPNSTRISDDSRIRSSLPTLQYLRQRRCKIILCSHLGRPEGRVVDSLRMAPISQRLSELLQAPVTQLNSCTGSEVTAAVSSLAPGDILMLENIRFHPGEEQNDPHLASQLAALADIYVNDAFGTAHRAHASTEGIAHLIPSAAGFLMQRELTILSQTLNTPQRPFAAVIGGAKVSDKIAVLQNLIHKVDLLAIGGDMAAAFISALGRGIGDSPVEAHMAPFADRIIHSAHQNGVNLLIPADVIVADHFAEDAIPSAASIDSIPNGFRIMDIGSNTIRRYAEEISACNTVIWNGAMGVFEWRSFAHGTAAIANTLAAMNHATTVTGGGSTAEAIASLGLTDKMTHVSSGGGASLEFIEGRQLPGVQALPDAPKPQPASP